MAEFIYTMIKARKTVGDKLILDDVTMSFFPGAKIGMVGPNGAGKSTILKIMAGLDTPSNGEATLSAGYSVGILMQEPELDETRSVLENVQDGVRSMYDKIERFNQISMLMAEPDADFDALLAEMGELQEAIDHADAWDLDSQLEQAMAEEAPEADPGPGAHGARIPEGAPAGSWVLNACSYCESGGTCREFRPTLERLAEARRDIVFAWADVEDDAELVGDLDVENFPTLALFRAGVALHYGVSLPHEAVVARLVETLAAAMPRAAPGLPTEIAALARRLS